MSEQPNIVWIVTTQWRFSATGYSGDSNILTPWIDGFKDECIDFQQAVSPHPMGPQARAALLTGKLAKDNGVRDYWDVLAANERTIAHAIRDRGYATAFFGKWHLAERDRHVPFVGEVHAKTLVPEVSQGGFEFWEGFEGGFLLNDPWLHGTRLPNPVHFKGYQSDILVERAAEWIKQPRSRPLFCIISLEAPHPPYDQLPPKLERKNPDEIHLRANVPRGGAIEKKSREELVGYYGHIEATDRSIGKFLSEIDLNDTNVVFTSVHGDMHGSHGLFRKAWPYEESVRVPLLVREANLKRHRVDDSPISLVDLSHMAVAWAEGRTWHCKRDNALISMPFAPAIPLQCDRAWYGFRTPKRKLICNSDGTPWLYFDLERDPYEMTNLVEDASRDEEIKRLSELL